MGRSEGKRDAAPATRHLSQLAAHPRLAVWRGALRRHPASANVTHPHANISLYLEGRAELWCGARYTPQAGDVHLIPEGMPHLLSGGDGARLVSLALCTACLTSEAGKQLADLLASVARGAAAVRTVPRGVRGSLRRAFDALEAELALDDAWSTMAIEGHLAVLAAALMRTDIPAEEARRAGAEGNALVQEALAFIARRALDGISLRDVARHVHRSVAHTAATIKQETGQTAVGWITHVRLAAAQELLLESDASIASIASRVGFASPSQFHRVFKRQTALTPDGWRRAHQRRGGPDRPPR